MKIYFNLNCQALWNEKIAFFSQETYDFQILGSETMILTKIPEFLFSIVGSIVMAKRR